MRQNEGHAEGEEGPFSRRQAVGREEGGNMKRHRRGSREVLLSDALGNARTLLHLAFRLYAETVPPDAISAALQREMITDTLWAALKDADDALRRAGP